MKFFILFSLWDSFYLSRRGSLPIEERTPAVRKAIISALRSNDKEILLSNLSTIEELFLVSESERIKSLKPGDFSGLSSLRRLSLFGNQLMELPEGVFSGLSSLRWLQLGSNRLGKLPEGVFSGFLLWEGFILVITD